MKQPYLIVITVFLVLIFVISCTPSESVIKYETYEELRRTPQMNRIETGTPLAKNQVRISGDYLFTVEEPQRVLFDKTHTTTSSFEQIHEYHRMSYLYESRHTITGNLAIGLSDNYSIGVGLTSSFGSVTPEPTFAIDEMEVTLNEPSVFLRGILPLQNMSVGIRLDLFPQKYNGRKLVIRDTTYSVEESIYGERNSAQISIFGRFLPSDNVAIFFGLQSQQRVISAKPKFEDSYGVYLGTTLQLWQNVSLSPFIAYSLPGSITNHNTPPQVGMNLAISSRNE